MVQLMSPPGQVVASTRIVGVEAEPPQAIQQEELSELECLQLEARIEKCGGVAFIPRLRAVRKATKREGKERAIRWTEIAEGMRIHQQTIYNILNPNYGHKINFSTLVEYAEFFGRIPVLAYDLKTGRVEFFGDKRILYDEKVWENNGSYPGLFVKKHVVEAVEKNPSRTEAKEILKKFGRKVEIKEEPLLYYIEGTSMPRLVGLEAIFRECGYSWMYLVEPVC